MACAYGYEKYEEDMEDMEEGGEEAAGRKEEVVVAVVIGLIVWLFGCFVGVESGGLDGWES